MKRSFKVFVTAAVLGGSVAAAAKAEAQAARVPTNNWRQADRTDALSTQGSPQHFAFEFRFGAYKPAFDSEFKGLAAGQGPYAQAFGDSSQFYFGLELDYLPLRIPYIGVVGPGFGWGWTHASAKAKLSSNHTTASAEDTSVTVMPMHLSLVLRADELMRRTGFPLVPYGKFGFGFGLWGANNSGGTASVGGHTFGLHYALGGMFCLNGLDPRAAAQLDDSTGINHAYFFGEWMNAQLNGLGSSPQAHIGASTWVVGLAMDM